MKKLYYYIYFTLFCLLGNSERTSLFYAFFSEDSLSSRSERINPRKWRHDSEIICHSLAKISNSDSYAITKPRFSYVTRFIASAVEHTCENVAFRFVETEHYMSDLRICLQIPQEPCLLLPKPRLLILLKQNLIPTAFPRQTLRYITQFIKSIYVLRNFSIRNTFI